MLISDQKLVNSAATRSGDCGGCSSVVTLFFANKSLTKTDRCAGALSLRRNQDLVLVFSGRFFLTAMKDVNVHFFIHCFTSCSNSCKLYQRIPENSWNYYV